MRVYDKPGFFGHFYDGFMMRHVVFVNILPDFSGFIIGKCFCQNSVVVRFKTEIGLVLKRFKFNRDAGNPFFRLTLWRN